MTNNDPKVIKTVETDFFKEMTPKQIAGLAIFLSSRAGAFTVGDVITCDGGVVVRVSNL